MKYTIQVTEEDIRNGKETSFVGCPVAIAATRAVGEIICVGVALLSRKNAPLLPARLPLVALQFIRRFDRGKDVKPFTFEIDIPQ